MKKNIFTLLFGLLLAVGWTNVASAQQLPDESLGQKLTTVAQTAVQRTPLTQPLEIYVPNGQSHSHEAGNLVKKTKAPASKKATAKMPAKRRNAPMRAGESLVMKSLTTAEASALSYTWDNGDGQGPRSSNATEAAKDPYQMYELLKFVYTNKNFPGPYYSAFTKDNERERKVYYGAVDGGWDITGDALPSGTTTQTVETSVTVADGTSTSTGYQYMPVYGYYFESAQTNQMIYTASQLGMKNGDKINSISFYPRDAINFSGGSITFSVANTTTSQFATNANVNANFTQVAQVTSYTVNNGKWTINFDQPFTYTGNNLLVQAVTTRGTYGRTYFYGQDQTNYQSRNSYSSTRYNFLPKATFGYTTEVVHDPSAQVGDITITGNNRYAMIYSITVKSGGVTLFSWDSERDGTAAANSTGYWPTGMNLSAWNSYSDIPPIIFSENYDVITLDDWLFMGYSDVTVEIEAANNQSTYPASLVVNGVEYQVTTPYSTAQGTPEIVSCPISGQSHSYPMYDPDYYKPNVEGYTALIVALKNEITHAPSDAAHEGTYFTTKEEIVNYFQNNVDSIKLLTDGLRIGSGEDAGTVFNCSGTYNKFFFLGKGQARQKPDVVVNREIAMEHALGEFAPFKCMFEQFSPTTGESDAEINDFYLEMMDGAVYDVVHDCRDVIRLGHQFSMSGNSGTQAYAMSGMNFFIPDYRLKYWEDEFKIELTDGTIYLGPFTVDGRITNPYQRVSADGDPTLNTSLVFRDALNYSFWYAWYNMEHAPKVGLYTLHLDAEAEPVTGYVNPGNTNYTVTLDWTSSLNEMSGSEVPQTYEIYEVTYDEDGNEVLTYITTVTNDTHYTFPDPFPQGDHSVTHTYIIKGWPTDNTHPSFIAWSNQDAVIIPGLNDFLSLGIDHYESDFDVQNVKNWYRNFLTVSNDNEAIGLTLGRIQDGEDTYALYRYDYEEQPDPSLAAKERVATIMFGANSNNTVDYLIEYENQEIEPYTIDKPNRNPPVHIENAYELSTMGIPTEGTLTVAAAGDIVIQPNGYDVNFLSITVQAGNYNQTWTSSQTSLPNGWSVTGGSMWVLENGAYYLEGGGFILIPASILGNYSTGTVTINAYGDPGKVAKITVNGTTHTLYNGENNARDYVFTVGNGAKLNAPNRAESINLPIEVTDYLTYENMGATSTSYATFTGKQLNSGAVLAGNTARGGSATSGYNIQMNSNSQRGLVTTASGGNRIKSITITVASGTNTIQVYGKNTAYTSAADLYQASTRGTLLGSLTATGTITVSGGDYQYFGIRSSNNAIYISSIEVVWEKVETPAYDNLIDDWDYNVDGVTMPTGWILTPGDATGSSGQGNGDAHNGIWMNEPGNITIPASVCDGYENIKVVAMYGIDPLYTGSSTMYLTANDVQGSNATIPFVTNEWSNVDASNGIVIVPNNGWLTLKSIRVYGDPVSIPPTPSGEGLVRMGNMMLVDQFADEIPDDNSHSRRWGYVLMLDDENSDNESGTVQVPVQHTGATVQGYYTVEEMLADTDPTDFLTEDVLSAELNMNLSPTSAPYYYTINSKKNDAPVDAWHNYVSVLQRREIGDYQEMQSPSPYNGKISQPGNYEFFDFRKVVADTKEDFLTYVPIIWTTGINRRYFVTDSLNNSYGAPIWEVHPGDVTINNSVVQRQARQDATGNWIWNNSVNYYVDDVPYSLYFAEVTATGVLPQNTGIEYEPYMFRVWLVDSTESLRDYTWTYNDDDEPLHIDDAGAIPGAWKLLDTYMCDGADDLVYSKSITTDYANNLQFAAPIENFHPIIMVRFYFKVKGAAPTPSGMRGQGEDNVGHVAIKGTNPHDPSTAVAELYINGEVVSKTYYNIQGMESDKPFDGINIVVTRYSNGATTTTKVRH